MKKIIIAVCLLAASQAMPEDASWKPKSIGFDVQRDHSFVDAGHALTSVGGVKSYEIAMYLVESLYGKEVTAGIAEGLVMDWDIEALHYVKGK